MIGNNDLLLFFPIRFDLGNQRLRGRWGLGNNRARHLRRFDLHQNMLVTVRASNTSTIHIRSYAEFPGTGTTIKNDRLSWQSHRNRFGLFCGKQFGDSNRLATGRARHKLTRIFRKHLKRRTAKRAFQNHTHSAIFPITTTALYKHLP